MRFAPPIMRPAPSMVVNMERKPLVPSLLSSACVPSNREKSNCAAGIVKAPPRMSTSLNKSLTSEGRLSPEILRLFVISGNINIKTFTAITVPYAKSTFEIAVSRHNLKRAPSSSGTVAITIGAHKKRNTTLNIRPVSPITACIITIISATATIAATKKLKVVISAWALVPGVLTSCNIPIHAGFRSPKNAPSPSNANPFTALSPQSISLPAQISMIVCPSVSEFSILKA